MPNHLESKTMAGLALLIGVAVLCAILGKLTPEMVDVLKWIGGSFMAMRAAANVAENLPGNKNG
jgi:threonine/homoserine/homoserine lactone efflux protein